MEMVLLDQFALASSYSLGEALYSSFDLIYGFLCVFSQVLVTRAVCY